MAFEMKFGPGEGFASRLAETVREGITKGFSGADAGTASGTVQLKFVPDFSSMESGFKESLGRIQTPSGGGGSTDTILTMILDELRGSRKANEAVAEVAKVAGGTGPVIGDGGGGGGGPVLPGTSSGLFGNRKSMAGWEMQRAMSDPAGFIQGGIMGTLLQKAGGLAMGDAGAGLASIGGLGSTALIGGALYGGFKIGDAINHGTLSAGEAEVQKRMRDSILSGEVGMDFRGSTYGPDRLRPNERLPSNFNFGYARSGMGAMGVHLGDMAVGDANDMPGFMSDMGISAHQHGYSADAMSGFIGQSWASGATDKTLSGTKTLLKNIEEAILQGNKLGISGNQTLQAAASLMQLEQSRTGVVSGAAMNGLMDEALGLGNANKHMFGGTKALSMVNALGTNNDPQARQLFLANMMGGNGKLTHEAQSKFESLGLGSMDGESGIYKAMMMWESPNLKSHWENDFAHQNAGRMNPFMLGKLLGIGGQSLASQAVYRETARNGFRRPDGWKTGDNGLGAEATDNEKLLAAVESNKEIAGSGASVSHLLELLNAERVRAEVMLEVSKHFDTAANKLSESVDTLQHGKVSEMLHVILGGIGMRGIQEDGMPNPFKLHVDQKQ